MTYSEATELKGLIEADYERCGGPAMRLRIDKGDAYKEDTYDVGVQRKGGDGSWGGGVRMDEYKAMRQYVYDESDPMTVYDAACGAA